MYRNIYSKYKCDDKIKIYSQKPMKNYSYKKIIENAKPRYMNDYYNTPRVDQINHEKYMKNILNNYYNDYNKFLSKFNVDEINQGQNSKYVNIDYNEYELKKKNLESLFYSYDMYDVNFDLTDSIIKSMKDENEQSLLLNIQTSNDYNFRLNLCDFEEKEGKIENNNIIEDENETNDIKNKNKENVEEKNIKKDEEEDDEYKDFENNVENKEKKVDQKKIKKNENLQKYQNMIIDNGYPTFEQLTNPNLPTKYAPPQTFPYQRELDENCINDDFANVDNKNNKVNKNESKFNEAKEIKDEIQETNKENNSSNKFEKIFDEKNQEYNKENSKEEYGDEEFAELANKSSEKNNEKVIITNGEKPKEEIQKEKSIDGEVIKKEIMNNNDNNNLKRTKLKESFDENEEEKYKENEFEDIKD